MRQRRLDLFVEQRHDAIQNIDEIEQHVLAFIDHRQALARVLLGLPDAGDLQPHARPEHLELSPRGSRIGSLQQIMRNVLLLAQNCAARGFGGMRREHRLDAHPAHQLQRLIQRHAGALQASDAISDTARLKGVRVA